MTYIQYFHSQSDKSSVRLPKFAHQLVPSELSPPINDIEKKYVSQKKMLQIFDILSGLFLLYLFFLIEWNRVPKFFPSLRAISFIYPPTEKKRIEMLISVSPGSKIKSAK